MDNRLVEILRPLVRPSTRLTVTQADVELPIDASKIGGTPYLAPNEAWPKCSDSCFPTTFVCQFDLAATALGSLGQVRFFQFFLCAHCERRHFITRSELPVRGEPVVVPEARAFVRPCSVEFETLPSLPDWDTIDQFSPTGSDVAVEMDSDQPWAAYQRAAAELGVDFDLRSAIGGYPKWLQGNCWPKGKSFVAQLDSEDGAELMWGDHYVFANPDGTGFVSLDEGM